MHYYYYILCVFSMSAEAALRLRLMGLPEKRFFTRFAISVPVEVSLCKFQRTCVCV